MTESVPKRRPRIKYALERDGAQAAPRDDVDNPFSPNFLTLDARDEREQARWWATHKSRHLRADTAELEGV